MKHLLICLAFLVLCPLAFAAGEMTTIDFSNSSSLLVQVGLGDGVRFDWAGKNHQILVRGFNIDNQKVMLTTFIEDSSVPYYTSVSPNVHLTLDFDRDDTNDMKVSFVKFIGEDYTLLLFEKLSEPKSKEEIERSQWFSNVFSRGPFQNVFYNLSLLVLIVVLVLVFLFSSRFVRRKWLRFRRSMRIG